MPFHSNQYVAWRKARYECILNRLGSSWFSGKSVAELGAGWGDFAAMFVPLGAHATAIEGREAAVAKGRGLHPEVRFLQQDLNHGLGTGEVFDLVLNVGVLYHVRQWEQLLRNCCAQARFLVLDTEVADSVDPDFVMLHDEVQSEPQNAIDGLASKPSPAAIERVLTECGFMFEHAKPEALWHVYDWDALNDNGWRRGKYRWWFAWPTVTHELVLEDA